MTSALSKHGYGHNFLHVSKILDFSSVLSTAVSTWPEWFQLPRYKQICFQMCFLFCLVFTLARLIVFCRWAPCLNKINAIQRTVLSAKGLEIFTKWQWLLEGANCILTHEKTGIQESKKKKKSPFLSHLQPATAGIRSQCRELGCQGFQDLGHSEMEGKDSNGFFSQKKASVIIYNRLGLPLGILLEHLLIQHVSSPWDGQNPEETSVMWLLALMPLWTQPGTCF